MTENKEEFSQLIQEILVSRAMGGDPQELIEKLNVIKERARVNIGLSPEESEYLTHLQHFTHEFDHTGKTLPEIMGMSDAGFAIMARVVDALGSEEPEVAKSEDIRALFFMAFSLGVLSERYVNERRQDADVERG